MAEISLGVLFKGFNPSKFVIYSCLLVFVILFALRLDGFIRIDYLFVFTPLWICNALIFVAGLVGAVSFCIRPPGAGDSDLRVDFIAMLITCFEHILLVIFECAIFYKLQYSMYDPKMTWIVVFAPLLCLSVLSIVFSVWAIRNDKSFELELFFAINVVQFVFVAFKLDSLVDWSWPVVFIPLWVVLSLYVVGVLYALILAVLLSRSRHLMPSHRRHHVFQAIFHTLLVFPALVSLILLTGKLDVMGLSDLGPGPTQSTISYTLVATPLAVSLSCMIVMSCGTRGGNVWWCGLRKPFCSWFLDTFPCVRQYANLSYKTGGRRRSSELEDPPPLLVVNEEEKAQQRMAEAAAFSLDNVD